MRFYTVFSLLALSRAAVIPFRHSARQGDAKLVVAHHMVGNTFPYTVQDWTDDMNLALASGLDGFALNVGPDDFQVTQTANAVQAAEALGNFKLFFSLDMSVLPCATVADGAALRSRVLGLAASASQMQFRGRALVSTFAGESCTFGQGTPADGWRSQFAQSPDLAGKIFFMPSFFIDPATFGTFNGVMDGGFNFNSGWPIQVNTGFAAGVTSDLAVSGPEGTNALNQFIGSNATDISFKQGLAAATPAPAYMAAAAPWFFTHFSPQTFNKNFVFLADQHLYARRWETLIAERDQVDLVEVVTWNDYGESHYIGPVKGALPTGSEVWVNNFPHDPLLKITQYYATQFKTGTAPTIDKDEIFMWSRPHPAQAQAPDPVGPPTTFQLTQDNVWALVMATAPGTVTLTTSPTNSQTFPVVAGVNKLSIPITPGGTLSGTVDRNGQTAVALNVAPSTFTFDGAPQTFNYNIFVASASA